MNKKKLPIILILTVFLFLVVYPQSKKTSQKLEVNKTSIVKDSSKIDSTKIDSTKLEMLTLMKQQKLMDSILLKKKTKK